MTSARYLIHTEPLWSLATGTTYFFEAPSPYLQIAVGSKGTRHF